MTFHFATVEKNLRAFHAIFTCHSNSLQITQISALKCSFCDALRINHIESCVSYLHCNYCHKYFCTSSIQHSIEISLVLMK